MDLNVETCGLCGFTYRESDAERAGADVVERASGIAALIVSADLGAVTTRAEPSTWSPLEYCCHLRDILLVQRERVLLARREDQPTATPMGRDERVDHDGYAEQNRDDVARQLTDAAALFARVLSRLSGNDWQRTLLYSYPTPAPRTLRWVAVHTVHELMHHEGDIRAGLS
jgi:hypothetical protein